MGITITIAEVSIIKDAATSTPNIRIKRVAVKMIGGRKLPAFGRSKVDKKLKEIIATTLEPIFDLTAIIVVIHHLVS